MFMRSKKRIWGLMVPLFGFLASKLGFLELWEFWVVFLARGFDLFESVGPTVRYVGTVAGAIALATTKSLRFLRYD